MDIPIKNRYNTIMMENKIQTIQIHYFKKDGFISSSNENEKHVKILPYLSIVQSVEGSYDIALGNGETRQTGEGGFFIAPSGVRQTIVHHRGEKNHRMVCRWLFLEAEINGVRSLDGTYRFPMLIGETEKREMNDLFDRLFSTEDVCKTYSCLYEIIGLLLRMAQPIERAVDPDLQNAVQYMKAYYATPIKVETLAKIANCSVSNFFAAFKRQWGVSPIAYLNQYRLSLAVDLLRETQSSIKEIAAAVGIEDALYFSKLFKKNYGATPSVYRAAYRNGSV